MDKKCWPVADALDEDMICRKTGTLSWCEYVWACGAQKNSQLLQPTEICLALQDSTTIESGVRCTFDMTTVVPGPSLFLFPGPSIYEVMLHFNRRKA